MTDDELLHELIKAADTPLCTYCGGPKDRDGKMCSTCIKLRNEHQRTERAKRKANGKCLACGRDPIPGKAQCSSCAARYASHRQRAKKEAMSMYGTVCQCCGEYRIEFLTIDHIDGNGAEHRREISAQGGQSFYIWLRANKYPAGFQVLCFNCNAAKGYFGACPHDKEREEMFKTQLRSIGGTTT